MSTQRTQTTIFPCQSALPRACPKKRRRKIQTMTFPCRKVLLQGVHVRSTSDLGEAPLMRRSCSTLALASSPSGAATPARLPSKYGRDSSTTSRFPKRTLSLTPSGLSHTAATTTTRRLSWRLASRPLPAGTSGLCPTSWFRPASRRVHPRARGAIQQSSPSASRLFPATRACAYRTKFGISCPPARSAIVATFNVIRRYDSIGDGVCRGTVA